MMLFISTNSGVFVCTEERRTKKHVFVSGQFPFFGAGAVPSKIPCGDTFFRIHYSLETAIAATSRAMRREAERLSKAAAGLNHKADRLITTAALFREQQDDLFEFCRRRYSDVLVDMA